MNFSKKNKKTLWYSLTLLLLGCYFVYNYVIYKPHRAVSKITSEYIGSASDFLIRLESEDTQNWLNKVVTLTGTVSLIDSSGVLLNNTIYCQFKNTSEIAVVQTKQSLSIKGQIIGYDDLLDELKLNYCTIKTTTHD